MSTHADYTTRIDTLEAHIDQISWWHPHTLLKRFVLRRYVAAARFRSAHGDLVACDTLVTHAENILNGDTGEFRKGLYDIISQRGTMSAG